MPLRHPARSRRRLIGINAVLGLLLVGSLAGAVYVAIARPGSGEPASLRTVAVTRGSVTSTVNGTGNLASTTVTTVNAAATGTLTSLAVTPGDVVKKGQVLARIDRRRRRRRWPPRRPSTTWRARSTTRQPPVSRAPPGEGPPRRGPGPAAGRRGRAGPVAGEIGWHRGATDQQRLGKRRLGGCRIRLCGAVRRASRGAGRAAAGRRQAGCGKGSGAGRVGCGVPVAGTAGAGGCRSHRREGHGAGREGSDDATTVRAPVSGTVLSVGAAVGDRVSGSSASSSGSSGGSSSGCGVERWWRLGVVLGHVRRRVGTVVRVVGAVFQQRARRDRRPHLDAGHRPGGRGRRLRRPRRAGRGGDAVGLGRHRRRHRDGRRASRGDEQQRRAVPGHGRLHRCRTGAAGRTASVDIMTGDPESVITVPTTAISTSGRANTVTLVKGGRQSEPRSRWRTGPSG